MHERSRLGPDTVKMSKQILVNCSWGNCLWVCEDILPQEQQVPYDFQPKHFEAELLLY